MFWLKNIFATSVDPDEPAHPRGLVRVYTDRNSASEESLILQHNSFILQGVRQMNENGCSFAPIEPRQATPLIYAVIHLKEQHKVQFPKCMESVL